MKHVYIPLLLVLSSAPVSFCQTIQLTPVWQKTAEVRTIEFSRNDSLLITGGATGNCYPYQCGQINVWKSSNGFLMNTITQQGMGLASDVDVSRNGSVIISGNGTVYCYPNGGCAADKPGQYKFNINGTLQRSLHNPGGNVYAIAFSPDDSLVAAGTGYNNTGEVRIYTRNFALLRTLPGHNKETNGLAFTPDKRYLVTGGDEGTIKLWDYSTGALLRTRTHGTYLDGGAFINVAVSADGRYVASAGQGYNMKTKVWKISDGTMLRELTVSGGDGYNTVAFTPDNRFVVSAITQYAPNGVGWFGRLLFWDIETGQLVKEHIDKLGSPQSGGIRTLAFSSSKTNYLAYSVSNRLKLFSWSADVKRPIVNVEAQPAQEIITEAFPNPAVHTKPFSY